MEAMTTEHLSKGKKFVFTILLITFSIVLIELGLQIFYRLGTGQWLFQWWAIPIYEPDDYRVYRVKSNLDYIHKTSEYTARYYTNAQGFRTSSTQDATSIVKPKYTYRIMYLGPSFTFGWGVNYEQSYAYLISKGLHLPDKKIEIINVGTPAQPINYQLAWLKKQGYRYDPDLIVQTVYADCCMNIAMDGKLPDDLPYVEAGYLYTPHPKTFSENTKRIIQRYRRYSAILFFAWRFYAALVADEEMSGIGNEFYEKTNLPDGCEPSAILKNYFSYQKFVWDALGEEIPIVFVYVPLAYIVRPADIIRVKHQGKHKDPLTERSMTQGVEAILNENNVHFIDLTGGLIRADGKTRMYNLYDIHFTPEGNQVAADLATPIIQNVIDKSYIGELK